MSGSSIGAEFEFNLIDNDGFIVNNADDILDDPNNNGTAVYEATASNVEVNSDPKYTVQELEENVLEKLSLLEALCESHGVQPIPASEYGAGRGIRKILPRYPFYNAFFGLDKNLELATVLGVHLHISQHPGKELDQYKVLLALDPLSYACTSTSPISCEGKNSLNCHRVNTVRNKIFNDFPLHAKLQEYPESLQELDQRNLARWEQWRDIALKNDFTKEHYEKIFKLGNTGYHAIRKRDEIGPTGTFEVRSFDTCPPNIALAAIALYKGVNDHFVNSNAEVEIAKENGVYSFNPEKIILPNYNTLRVMENEVIRYGLKSNMISEYLKSVVDFAEKGLPEEDLPYLSKVKDMLRTRMNLSSEIMQHLRGLGFQGHEFNPDQTAQANLYMRDQHLKALENPQYLLN